jgi:hypothetical protein
MMADPPMTWDQFNSQIRTSAGSQGDGVPKQMWNPAQQEEQVGIAWFQPLKTKSATTELAPLCAPPPPLPYPFAPPFQSFSFLVL